MNESWNYSYEVKPMDGQFVGLCTKHHFRYLSWFADTPREAAIGIIDLVSDVVEDMKAKGEPVP